MLIIGYTRHNKSEKPAKKLLFIAFLAFVAFIALSQLNPISAEPQEEYMGPGYCVACHASEMEKYTQSAHKNALSNPEFQKVWTDLGEEAECLECHTTGYDPETKTYALPEVTCEECHGPGDTMDRDTSPELCGECHTGPYPTYDEWASSGPSHGAADCITCHNEHTSELEYSTSTETCGQCHETHVEENADTTHGVSDVNCVNCHMIIEEADFYTGKQAKTGHTFNPSQQDLDCHTCHTVELEKHDVLGEKAAACLSCHGDIHELKLELINSKTYPLNEPVQLCAQCHNERYTSWADGTHGAHDNPEAVCTECHNPHNPVINNISTLEPIPPREQAKPSSWIAKMTLVVLLEIFGFGVWINRSGK